ncbi:MAG: hypothetical protein ABIG68_01860 [Acidobacteriota bacterium]
MKRLICASLLLVLSFSGLLAGPLAAAHSRLCLAATFYCDSDAGDAVLGITGLVSGIGIEAAGIILCVNPWLALGVGVAYGA